MNFVFACLIAGLPLLAVELLVRKWQMPSEASRKLVHVFSAIAVVSVTALCSLDQIAVIAGLFFFILLAVRSTGYFRSIYGIKRRSIGEVLFPVGVAGAAIIATTDSMFIAVVLILGLSDTAASLAGSKFGGKIGPRWRGKSLAGSAAFALVTATILLIVPLEISFIEVIIVSLVLSTMEFVSPYGTDNLTVPLTSVLLLYAL